MRLYYSTLKYTVWSKAIAERSASRVESELYSLSCCLWPCAWCCLQYERYQKSIRTWLSFTLALAKHSLLCFQKLCLQNCTIITVHNNFCCLERLFSYSARPGWSQATTYDEESVELYDVYHNNFYFIFFFSDF